MPKQHDIFLSYSRKDKARVQPIVQLLEQQGWAVWWDPKIPHGIRFGDYIEEQLDNSKLVVVVWSEHSKKSKWVKEEASEGDHKNALFPLKIDEVRPPLGFRGIQTANFVNWNTESAEVKLFLDSIHNRLGTTMPAKVKKPIPKKTTPPIIKSVQDIDYKNGILTDPRDGQTYKTIKIGNQIWMAENLNFEVEGSWWYDNKKENGNKYGRLYTWEAAKKACPEGWHLPMDEEWKILMKKMGGYYDGYKGEIGDAKASYQALIQGGISNFSVLLGGNRDSIGKFNNLDENGLFWSATGSDAIFAWDYFFDRDFGRVTRDFDYKLDAFSCRCIKD